MPRYPGNAHEAASAVQRRDLGRRAAAVIVALWGGILLIAQVEQMLPPEIRWWGHAFVHLWTATWTAIVVVAAVRLMRTAAIGQRVLQAAVWLTALLASVAAVTGALEVVGAYPDFRPFHDAVNTVAAPVGWLLLGSLTTVMVLTLIPFDDPGDRPGITDA
jgi:hypothetical protein